MFAGITQYSYDSLVRGLSMRLLKLVLIHSYFN